MHDNVCIFLSFSLPNSAQLNLDYNGRGVSFGAVLKILVCEVSFQNIKAELCKIYMNERNLQIFGNLSYMIPFGKTPTFFSSSIPLHQRYYLNVNEPQVLYFYRSHLETAQLAS